jgi:hypothetical protein
MQPWLPLPAHLRPGAAQAQRRVALFGDTVGVSAGKCWRTSVKGTTLKLGAGAVLRMRTSVSLRHRGLSEL